MLSPYNLLLIKHITFIQERNISRENMSFVCSNRFIKSIEPHVKLVTLQLLWWRQPGCCSCDIMIDYKTQSTSLSLQHHSFFSFSKLIFESRQKIKLITSWRRYFIAGSFAQLAASLTSLFTRTVFSAEHKNTLSVVLMWRLEYTTTHWQHIHHICHAYNKKWKVTICLVLQCTMVTIHTTSPHSAQLLHPETTLRCLCYGEVLCFLWGGNACHLYLFRYNLQVRRSTK